jgi:transcriptional regulator with PAS, ATPase and Fis domain
MSEPSPKNPPRLKDRLESLCTDMIDRGILFKEAVEQFEKCFITEVVRRSDHSVGRAAESLGIHRNTLAKRIAEFRARSRPRASGTGR